MKCTEVCVCVSLSLSVSLTLSLSLSLSLSTHTHTYLCAFHHSLIFLFFICVCLFALCSALSLSAFSAWSSLWDATSWNLCSLCQCDLLSALVHAVLTTQGTVLTKVFNKTHALSRAHSYIHVYRIHRNLIEDLSELDHLVPLKHLKLLWFVVVVFVCASTHLQWHTTPPHLRGKTCAWTCDMYMHQTRSRIDQIGYEDFSHSYYFHWLYTVR